MYSISQVPELVYIDYTPDVSSTVLKDTLGLNVKPG